MGEALVVRRSGGGGGVLFPTVTRAGAKVLKISGFEKEPEAFYVFMAGDQCEIGNRAVVSIVYENGSVKAWALDTTAWVLDEFPDSWITKIEYTYSDGVVTLTFSGSYSTLFWSAGKFRCVAY